ncbi:MAG: oxygen-independent coproporphyrinogen III oxidase [Proteobacteria bacterium]|nr:oxygen-independent coproporphyrinogen III oxidase [Pseudomonadota bacterium]
MSTSEEISFSRDIDPKILNLLESQAPRYTSYPAANRFQELNHTVAESWLSTLPSDKSVGLYIHIPFCPKLCWYCGCHTKMTYRYEPIETYIDLLLEELRLLATHLLRRPKLHSLHFGGGSPTILKLKDLDRLFYAIHSTFDVLPTTEIALEIDPRAITKHEVGVYAALGFNRVSLGIQDFDEKVQKTVNRFQPFDLVSNCTSLLRESGISNISMDLIYGLPFQTSSSIKNTIEKLLYLEPNRIAYFSYAHLPHLKKHQRLIPENALPNTLEKTWFYLIIKNLLEKSGYKSIGIDHFAKEGDDLFLSLQNKTLRRNFMGYTPLPNDYILGVGMSSVSELGHGLAQNSIHFLNYKTKIQYHCLPASRGWRYHGDDHIRKAVINHLMCYFEVDLNEILTQQGYPLHYLDRELTHLKELETMGIVSVKNRKVQFQADLPMLVRSVAVIFDSYIHGEGKPHSKVA